MGPCIQPLKLFFQTLWEEKKGWDDVLSEKEQTQWESFQENWKDQTIRIPRRSMLQGNPSLQLHAFVDASIHTFAAAIYLRAAEDPPENLEEVSLDNEEKVFFVNTRTEELIGNPLIDPKRFSSWTKIVQVTLYVLRFLRLKLIQRGNLHQLFGSHRKEIVKMSEKGKAPSLSFYSGIGHLEPELRLKKH
ncbi:hypothetical protein niasHT_002834 [Heterodera trifolii]|uniref:Uncharacterized protein n=1 Tax=Heterodera trifolii TaxID=157864 RepID=A0ABD2LQI8_9BILA